jgi:hypothetical protein
MSSNRFPMFALFALFAGGVAGCTVYTEVPPPPAPPVVGAEVGAGGEVDLGIFYDGLGAYGEWIERPGYGRVWYPTAVRAGWRPYLYGRWVVSDYGWTWVSEEEFGWATYHYGRWFQDAEVGWLWVPGREWGPAWVSFQQGGGYIGWAPLPPGVAFRAGFGIELGGVAIAAGTYSFCEERAFLHPQIATVVLPPARNVTIINNTTNITNYTVVNNKIVNQSVSVQHVEQATGQRVQRYQIAAASSRGATSIQGNQISIYKPSGQARAHAGASQPSQPSQNAAGSAGGTAAGQAKRGSQQGQPSQDGAMQSGTAQNRATQSRGGAQQPAGAAGTTGSAETAGQLSRRHQGEMAQLQAKHAAERSQLQANHQEELAAAKSSNANTAELKRKHDAEARAQQQQHQKEQAALEARHKQEKSAHHPPR